MRGSVRWAAVPYSPSAPFRVYAQRPVENLTFAQLRPLAGSEKELTFMTPGKVRPVLILSDPSPRMQEATALRLLRFSKLTREQQDHVRQQRDELLFHVAPGRFKLPEENAAIISALVRVNVSAIDTTSLGELGAEEMRVLGERIIRFYRFDTRLLVERRLQELAELQKRRRPPGGSP